MSRILASLLSVLLVVGNVPIEAAACASRSCCCSREAKSADEERSPPVSVPLFADDCGCGCATAPQLPSTPCKEPMSPVPPPPADALPTASSSAVVRPLLVDPPAWHSWRLPELPVPQLFLLHQALIR